MYYITRVTLHTRTKRRSGWETDTRDTVYELIVPRKENGAGSSPPRSTAIDHHLLCAMRFPRKLPVKRRHGTAAVNVWVCGWRFVV